MKREKGYFAKVYAEKKGYRLDKPDNAVLLPFIMADSIYLIYDEYIKPQNFKYNLKWYCKKMMKAYNEFHKDFFNVFNQEDIDSLIDYMDEFAETVKMDIKLLKISVSNHLQELPSEVRNNLASMTALVHLSQSTRIMYKELYRNRGEAFDNKHLAGIVSNAESLFKAYTKMYAHNKQQIDLNKYKDVEDASKRICDKIIKFMNTL